MKRLHVHVGVDRLDEAVRFYSALFGVEPSKQRPDHAKWMLEDPRINFAISTRVGRGVDHLGIQVDEESELAELRQRIRAAGMQTFEEGETICCYAHSDKTWLQDPAGIAWEAYHTMEDAQTFHGHEEVAVSATSVCCAPETVAVAASTSKNGNAESAMKAVPGCCCS